MVAGIGHAQKSATDHNPVHRVKLLPPGPGNPLNSEGAFLQLKGDRLLFIYTHFTGGSADYAASHLASRHSEDGGKTWRKSKTELRPPPASKSGLQEPGVVELKDGD